MTTYYNNNVNQIKKGLYLMFYSHLQSFAIGIVIASLSFAAFLSYEERKIEEEQENKMIEYTKSKCVNSKSSDTALCDFLKKMYL